MKKALFALLIALFGATSLFACEECRKKELAAKRAKQGVLFSGWKLAPLQLGLGIDGWRGLADKNCDTAFTFGLWWMRQNSAVLSLAAFPELRNNYGIQLSPTIADSGHNYGLSLGFFTTGARNGNHGLRIGIFDIEGKFEKIQFIGVNCFDFLHLSLYNRGDQAVQIGLANFTRDHDNDKGYFQFGLFNRGDTAFQIGLLNYNPHSYILPVLPLVNFGANPKKEKEETVYFPPLPTIAGVPFGMMPKEEPHPPRTIPATVTKSGEKEETVYLPAR